jgi:ArsR family transcriptional regulator, arsenate/arsenite/antimonite-responsive transcriptional repressor
VSGPSMDHDRVPESAARSPQEKELTMISTIDSPFTEEMTSSQIDASRANAPFPELSEQLEKDLVQVFKLLADETRLKILMGLLREGEMHVSAMCDMLDQSQPAVSHHLALLRVAGIIEPRRDGKHNYYSVCQDRFHQLMGELFSTISDPKRDEFRFKSFVVTKDQ